MHSGQYTVILYKDCIIIPPWLKVLDIQHTKVPVNNGFNSFLVRYYSSRHTYVSYWVQIIITALFCHTSVHPWHPTTATSLNRILGDMC